MAGGFKGTRMGISEVSIRGSFAKTSIQFLDDDGVVHATQLHNIPIGEHEELRNTAQAFFEALHAHISKIHFTDPDHPEQTETRHGIAEALRGGAADSDDSDGFEEGG